MVSLFSSQAAYVYYHVVLLFVNTFFHFFFLVHSSAIAFVYYHRISLNVKGKFDIYILKIKKCFCDFKVNESIKFAGF